MDQWKRDASSLVLSKMNHVVTLKNYDQILVFNIRKRFRILKLSFYFDNCNLHLKFWMLCKILLPLHAPCIITLHFLLLLESHLQVLHCINVDRIFGLMCALCDVCCCLHVITCKLCQLVTGVGLSTCELLKRLKGFISNICKDKFSRVSLLGFWFFK